MEKGPQGKLECRKTHVEEASGRDRALGYVRAGQKCVTYSRNGKREPILRVPVSRTKRDAVDTMTLCTF